MHFNNKQEFIFLTGVSIIIISELRISLMVMCVIELIAQTDFSRRQAYVFVTHTYRWGLHLVLPVLSQGHV